MNKIKFMRIFWAIWGCVSAALGAGLISICWRFHLWGLLIFNLIVTAVALLSCYNLIKYYEEIEENNA